MSKNRIRLKLFITGISAEPLRAAEPFTLCLELLLQGKTNPRRQSAKSWAGEKHEDITSVFKTGFHIMEFR